MEATYRFRFTEEHLIESHRRYQQRSSWRRLFFTIRWAFSLLMAGLFALMVYLHERWAALFFAAVLGSVSFGGLIEIWLIRRRFRQSPFLDEELTFVFSESDVQVRGASQDSRLSWAIYTRACQFEDGVLLFQGSHIFSWLPDAAAAGESDASRFRDLVRAKIGEVRIIRTR